MRVELKPYRRRALFYETDGMGIIYHGNYIHWMEEARTDFLDQLGWSYQRVREQGLDFGVAEVGCRHTGMVRFGDEVEVNVSLQRLSPAKLTLRYEIRDAGSGELRAEGWTRHFFWDRKLQRAVALKRALPELYALLEERGRRPAGEEG